MQAHRLAATAGLLFCLLGCGKSSVAAPLQAPTGAPRAQAVQAKALAGDWTMHLFIGERHFQDKLHLELNPLGQLGGTLSVPGAFTSRLEKVQLEGDKLSFEILADEKPKPFRVRYEGTLAPKAAAYVGMAALPESGEFLGGFVTQRDAAPVKGSPKP